VGAAEAIRRPVVKFMNIRHAAALQQAFRMVLKNTAVRKRSEGTSNAQPCPENKTPPAMPMALTAISLFPAPSYAV